MNICFTHMTEDSECVKLVSSDNVYFKISESTAIQSVLFQTLLNKDHLFIEGKERTFSLPINSRRLRRVIEYLEFKERYSSNLDEVPEFPVTGEEAIDLLEISAYLKI